jgi:hypothetical protein
MRRQKNISISRHAIAMWVVISMMIPAIILFGIVFVLML